jgi:Family of unknown function (DUF6286)
MRAALRVLAPLLGLGLAVVGVLLVIEVVAAWLQPPVDGVIVPWPAWRSVLETMSWQDDPVPLIAIGVGVVGLVLLLIGLLARRSDVVLAAPAEEMTVTTSPRVLARLVGRRVRAGEDVASAAVTASRRRVAVTAQGWADPDPQLQESVAAGVEELLDELPLQQRPRVTVRVVERRYP